MPREGEISYLSDAGGISNESADESDRPSDDIDAVLSKELMCSKSCRSEHSYVTPSDFSDIAYTRFLTF